MRHALVAALTATGGAMRRWGLRTGRSRSRGSSVMVMVDGAHQRLPHADRPPGRPRGKSRPRRQRPRRTGPVAPAAIAGSPLPTVVGSSTPRSARILGLDGIRGLAALFVVMNHIFLRAFPGYPATTCTVLGGGIHLRPVRGGRVHRAVRLSRWRSVRPGPGGGSGPSPGLLTGGPGASCRRIGPHWASAFDDVVRSRPAWMGRTRRQVRRRLRPARPRFVPAAIPNRAFWSIAIEAQLYFLLPLLLLMVRRVNALAMVAAVAAIVITVGASRPARGADERRSGPVHPRPRGPVRDRCAGRRDRQPPSERTRRRPWAWLALAAAIPVIALIAEKGSVWTIDHLFWVDLAMGPGHRVPAGCDRHRAPRILAPPSEDPPAAEPWLVLVQPLSDSRADRHRRCLWIGAPQGRARRADLPCPHRGRGAADFGLRPPLRCGVRDPIPAPPGLGAAVGGRHQFTPVAAPSHARRGWQQARRNRRFRIGALTGGAEAGRGAGALTDGPRPARDGSRRGGGTADRRPLHR